MAMVQRRTLISLSLDKNWMLNGPVMFKQAAIFAAAFLTSLDVMMVMVMEMVRAQSQIPECLDIKLLCGENKSGITAMNAGILDMFGDGKVEDLSIESHTI